VRASELSADLQRKIFGEVIDTPKRDVKGDAEKAFAFQCRAYRLPMFKREYKFAAEALGRGWRFDFCWPAYKAALEVEGLCVKRVNGELVTTGRHVHPAGFRADAEKYATAAVMGWHVLRFEQTQISSGVAIDFTVQLLRSKGWVDV
jgi:very-short-patch-repair endonuclease